MTHVTLHRETREPSCSPDAARVPAQLLSLQEWHGRLGRDLEQHASQVYLLVIYSSARALGTCFYYVAHAVTRTNHRRATLSCSCQQRSLSFRPQDFFCQQRGAQTAEEKEDRCEKTSPRVRIRRDVLLQDFVECALLSQHIDSITTIGTSMSRVTTSCQLLAGLLWIYASAWSRLWRLLAFSVVSSPENRHIRWWRWSVGAA